VKGLLIVLGIGAAILAAQNWKTCSQAYVLVDANGKPVLLDASGNPITPCAPGACHSVGSSRTPQFGCLFNPFPGGL
jgi:hypothetical protein